MKVYVLMICGWSDYNTIGIFSTREKAQKHWKDYYHKIDPCDMCILEWEVDTLKNGVDVS